MNRYHINLQLVDSSNFSLGEFAHHQYADRILLYNETTENIRIPLCYIGYDKEKNKQITWTKYGKKEFDRVTRFMKIHEKEIEEMFKIIELEWTTNNRLHKRHQDPSKAHKRKNEN